MSQEQQFGEIPVPIMSPRGGQFKVGDEVNNRRVVGTRPDGTPIFDEQPTSVSIIGKKAQQQPQGKKTVSKGAWLRTKIQGLEADPAYKHGNDTVKRYYRTRAYDQWVAPYFKHIGQEPPNKEEWITQKFTGAHKTLWEGFREQLGLTPEVGMQVMKTSASSAEGITNTLKHLSSFMDRLSESIESDPTFGSGKTPERKDSRLTKSLGQFEHYLHGKEEFWKTRLEDRLGHEPTWSQDTNLKINELATQGIFFEASGAGKAAEIFKIANPKTAKIAVQLGKAAYNGAIDGFAYSLTDPHESNSGYTVGGAILGPLGRLGSLGFDKAFGKVLSYIPSSQQKAVITGGLVKASQPPIIYNPNGSVVNLLPKARSASGATINVLQSGTGVKLKTPDVLAGLLPDADHNLGKQMSRPADIGYNTWHLMKENTEKAGGLFLGVTKLKDNHFLIWFNSPEHGSTMGLITDEMAPTVEHFKKTLANARERMGFSNKITTEGSTPPTQLDKSKTENAVMMWLHRNSQERYGKNFYELSKGQQRFLLVRMLALDAEAKAVKEASGAKVEAIGQFIAEEEKKLTEAFPKAKETKQIVDGVAKAAGDNPVSNKIAATLPHHNTDINSPVKSIAARISFLANKLKGVTDREEKQAIAEALKEEKRLLDEVRTKQKKSKPGAALINDTNAFKGEDFIVRPAVHGEDSWVFRDWIHDFAARKVSDGIKETSPVGAMDRKVQQINQSFEIGNMLESFLKSKFGDTVVLNHSQFGNIGGANFQILEHKGEKTLMLNWIGLRPNVVARNMDVPGAGQTLFLSVLEKARANDAGVQLQASISAVPFYEKMGMKTIDKEHNIMQLSAQEVKEILAKKGLLMALIGAGITYGTTNDQLDNNVNIAPVSKSGTSQNSSGGLSQY